MNRENTLPLLHIKGLRTYFFLDEGVVKAVESADLTIYPGTTVGVVGESGCGKSVTAFSVLQLVQPPGRIVDGQILWMPPNGKRGGTNQAVDLAKLHPDSREMRAVRG